MANLIVAGDALETMAGLDDFSVDAIVTDPPYCAWAIGEAQRTGTQGQGLRSENLKKFGWFTGDNMGTAGLTFLLRAMAYEGLRVIKPTGHLVVFCDWRMLATLQPAVESSGWRFQSLVVWDKGSMGLGLGFRAQHELAMHFTAGSPEYHDQGTPNVIRCGRVGADEREHQTQKPVDLMRRIVRVVAPVDGEGAAALPGGARRRGGEAHAPRRLASRNARGGQGPPLALRALPPGDRRRPPGGDGAQRGALRPHRRRGGRRRREPAL